MLFVTAFKLGNPMVFGVDMVADNFSLHTGRECCTGAGLWGGAGALARIEGVDSPRRVQSESLCVRGASAKSPALFSERGRDDKSLVDLCQ